MGRSDTVHEDGLFSCYPLVDMDDADERDIAAFVPANEGGAGLVEYLRREALSDELAGLMRTYLVRDRDTLELAGYFSLKAGLASLNESERGEGGAGSFDTVPGVELANFAVNGAYLRAHPSVKGCGRIIFNDLVRRVVEDAAALVGVYIVYLFSLPEEKVIANYERYGFSRLGPDEEALLHARLKPRYDQSCVFMYMLL